MKKISEIQKMYEDVAIKDKSVKKATFYNKESIPPEFKTEVFGCGNPVQYMEKTKKNLLILDAGCGAGIDIFLASKKALNATFIGIDFSFNMLKRAQDNCKKHNINAFFIQSDLNNIPIKTNTFDIVISNACFHLLENKQPLFSELNRITKKNSEFYISDIMLYKKWKSNFFKKEYRKTGGIFLYGGIETKESYLKKIENNNIDTNILKEDFFNPAKEIIPTIKSKYPDLKNKVIKEFEDNIFILIDYFAWKGERHSFPNYIKCQCGQEMNISFKPQIFFNKPEFQRLKEGNLNISKCDNCGKYNEVEDSFMIFFPPREVIIKFPEKWEDFKDTMESEIEEIKKRFDVTTYFSNKSFFEKINNIKAKNQNSLTSKIRHIYDFISIFFKNLIMRNKN